MYLIGYFTEFKKNSYCWVELKLKKSLQLHAEEMYGKMHK